MRARIVNVVAVADLGCRLDLHAAAAALRGSLGWRGGAMVLRVRLGRALLQIHGSGKVTVIAPRERAAAKAASRLVRELRRFGFIMPNGTPELRVTNVVAVADLGRRLDLAELAGRLEGFYEPEIHPALFVRSGLWHYMVFGSGMVNVLGMRSESELGEALAELSALLG